MRTVLSSLTTTVLLSLVAACGAHAGGSGEDVDAGADSAPEVDADETPVDAGVCGMQQANIGVQNLGDPPDMLVVLDRSGSMLNNAGTTQKWAAMKTALTSVVTGHQDEIKFGLLEFPSDGNCGAKAVPDVSVGLSSGAGFTQFFANNTPGPNENTPAYLALAGALTYFNQIPVNPAGRYVVFATDGLPNCLNGVAGNTSINETIAAVQNLYNAGIKTYVLGFGSLDATATSTLNSAADAGGLARPGTTHYYEAQNQAQLDTVLQSIAGGIIQPSCSFALQSLPPEPDNVTVTINGTAVPRSQSHANGWDYSPNAQTITFFGSYCTMIENGASTDVSFSYGCKGPV
ncbi:MAG TPA: vWA domain-containing protein, partial [Kofleriaceae bacterium]